jgi:hypothetical protein
MPDRVHPVHAHLNGRYADQDWSLAPLTGNPSVSKVALHWQTWAAPLREEMRLAAWTLINGQLRPTFVQVRASRMRPRLSLEQSYGAMTQWKLFAAWLEERGIGTLADCTAGVLHDYGLHVRDSGHSRGHVMQILVSLTRLWAFDQLSARPSGVGRPPWDELGADDWLGRLELAPP